MRLIAFDPGGTTGVCIYDDSDPSTESFTRFELFTQPHHEQLWTTLAGDWDAIIYERFMYQRRELTKGVSLNQDALEYIGIIKLHAAIAEAKLVEQTPAQAKNFWTDDKLKKLKLWVSSPHERDAIRHMLYYITFTLGDHRFIQALR